MIKSARHDPCNLLMDEHPKRRASFGFTTRPLANATSSPTFTPSPPPIKNRAHKILPRSYEFEAPQFYDFTKQSDPAHQDELWFGKRGGNEGHLFHAFRLQEKDAFNTRIQFRRSIQFITYGYDWSSSSRAQEFIIHEHSAGKYPGF